MSGPPPAEDLRSLRLGALAAPRAAPRRCPPRLRAAGERAVRRRARRSACRRPRPRRSARPSPAPRPLRTGAAARREGERLQPLLVLEQVPAGLAPGPLLGREQRLVERDQRLQALDLVFAERAQHPPAWPARGRRPRRSAWRPSGRTSARPRRLPARPSRRARPGRSARGSGRSCRGRGRSSWRRPRR